jgi:hypothetical protein
MFWWKPYEALMEQKPKSGDAAIAELLAKELVEFLEAFPPAEDTIDWADDAFAAKYRGRLHELPKVDVPFCATLFELVQLDLNHETERIDWIIRNDHHRASCPTQAHIDALMLLWPVLVEHLYTRKDECKGILKRAHLLEICADTERRFRAKQQRLLQ